ncbi:PREDICTED: coilin-like isoform X2 [Cyprinodon variegatus]|uniref:coilin-like isoform X2 n=1 Tax=Cyprinodon variegatus TaxID=28743 RepID=UPI000742C16D|nr:PREDICTED: coilin-like isoform X2 [Cyprinodon variegatus]
MISLHFLLTPMLFLLIISLLPEQLLELTENYTPEVSEYKEGKIVNFDPTSKQIELELLNASPAPSEPGKFDLVYQNPDGSERVEYAVQRGSTVMERWDSLLEPRLIIET